MNRLRVGMTTALSVLVLSLPCLAQESPQHQTRLKEAQTLLEQQKFHKAYMHFHALAAKGCPSSQCIIGLMHQHGVGVPRDAHQAAYWLERAARLDLVQAQLDLGRLYAYGNNTVHDPEKALYWFEKAASHNFAEAQYELGRFYVHFDGASKLAAAKQLLESAARKGYKEAGDLVAKMPQVPSASPTSQSQFENRLKDVQQSWGGYTNVAKKLASLDKQGSEPQ